jgi:hypothetical protein
VSDAFDKGSDLFKSDPELLLAAVWHVAAKQYQNLDNQREFVNGYTAARTHRDAYHREKNESSS